MVRKTEVGQIKRLGGQPQQRTRRAVRQRLDLRRVGARRNVGDAAAQHPGVARPLREVVADRRHRIRVAQPAQLTPGIPGPQRPAQQRRPRRRKALPSPQVRPIRHIDGPKTRPLYARRPIHRGAMVKPMHNVIAISPRPHRPPGHIDRAEPAVTHTPREPIRHLHDAHTVHHFCDRRGPRHAPARQQRHGVPRGGQCGRQRHGTDVSAAQRLTIMREKEDLHGLA